MDLLEVGKITKGRYLGIYLFLKGNKMSKSLRSLKFKLEKEIKELSSAISEMQSECSRMQKVCISTRKFIKFISKEELCKLILDGTELHVDYNDLEIYVELYHQETENEFAVRKNKILSEINSKIKLKDKMQKELEEVKQEIEAKDEKYKNPEYIEFLRLQAKFKEE